MRQRREDRRVGNRAQGPHQRAAYREAAQRTVTDDSVFLIVALVPRRHGGMHLFLVASCF